MRQGGMWHSDVDKTLAEIMGEMKEQRESMRQIL
jgi:hypothetical protein